MARRWRVGPGPPLPGRCGARRAGRLLDSFAGLHAAEPAWQRERAALLIGGALEGLAVLDGGRPLAYVLFRQGADGPTLIADAGATAAPAAAPLLAALQGRGLPLVLYNEPSDSPLVAAFLAAGFVETSRQHEMMLEI